MKLLLMNLLSLNIICSLLIVYFIMLLDNILFIDTTIIRYFLIKIINRMFYL